MSIVKGSKINHLLQQWPKGTVATSVWLNKLGIRFDLVDRYRKSSWMKSIGHGAVIRAGDKVEWEGALHSLQEQLGSSMHPGGKTALALQGLTHFIPMGREKIFLFKHREEHIPVWFLNQKWHPTPKIFSTELFPAEEETDFTKINHQGLSLVVSSPERAAMEMLYTVPTEVSASEASLIMEGLVSLRPNIVQKLLRECSSVKVKRLFLVLAEKYKHAWLAKIDKKHIDLGKGKRMFVKGGVLHSKYQITIPKEWQKEQ